MVVNPFWPLLGTMLGGVWLGWPWFLFNARALRTEQWGNQVRTVIVGLLVSVLFAWVILLLVGYQILEPRIARYVVILLTGWKLAVSYRLQMQQQREFQVFQYYGGVAREGHKLAIVSVFLRPVVLGKLIPAGWWIWVLS
jgi:hypothetical protein